MIARTEKDLKFRPRLVLAHEGDSYSGPASRHFRLLGWEVHLAHTAAALRRLVWTLDPVAVVLSTELRDESGWLACIKLLSEQPERKVVLVSSHITAGDHSFAEFVGAAALVDEVDGAPALLDAVHGTALSALSVGWDHFTS